MNAAAIAHALKGKRCGKYWSCCCPAHHDSNPSLSIWDGHTAVRVHCWSGCDALDVIAALRERGLWEPQARRPRGTAGERRPRQRPRQKSVPHEHNSSS